MPSKAVWAQAMAEKMWAFIFVILNFKSIQSNKKPRSFREQGDIGFLMFLLWEDT
jgi:hypothetical protein